MKLAFLISSLAGGGAERVITNISNALNGKHECKMVLFRNTVEYECSAPIFCRNEAAQKNSVIELVIQSLLRLPWLIGVKRKLNADVFISFMEYSSIFNIITKRKEKTIISVRNYTTENIAYLGLLSRMLVKLAIRLTFRHADRIVSVSKAAKDDLVENFGVKGDCVHVIYNPLNLEMIAKLSQEPLSLEEQAFWSPNTIVSLGRLEKQKGFWHLIRVFSKVRESVPDAKLVIIGRGSMEADLHLLAERMGVSEHVLFAGFQSNPYKYLQKASVYASTSLWEGFPNALAEAMACGLPVVSTDCKSGPREMLAPGEPHTDVTSGIFECEYGVLTEPMSREVMLSGVFEPEELLMAQAITRMLTDRELNRYYRGQSLIKASQLHVEAITSEWEALIEDVCQDRKH